MLLSDISAETMCKNNQDFIKRMAEIGHVKEVSEQNDSLGTCIVRASELRNVETSIDWRDRLRAGSPFSD